MGETSLKEMAVFSTSRTRLKTLASVQELPPVSQTLDYLLNTVGRSRQHARLFTQGFFSLPRPRAELQPWWLRFSAWSGDPAWSRAKPAPMHAGGLASKRFLPFPLQQTRSVFLANILLLHLKTSPRTRPGHLLS